MFYLILNYSDVAYEIKHNHVSIIVLVVGGIHHKIRGSVKYKTK